MRPLRLLLDGFASYRQPVDIDFSDVNFFALVGPTGSGKSTVIDGLCFALYGTVPRWGKENAIAQALAPTANSCKICLVFEASGRRYAIVRALTRDSRGQVHTKEARLELLDPTFAVGAPLDQVLAASSEQVAEGPDDVKAQVQKVLGLTYEHFIRSVLLPQGQFAEFLRATASERQSLLVELLAFGVYEQVGQRARERVKLHQTLGLRAQEARAELTAATEEAETRATACVEALTRLTRTVDERLSELTDLRTQAQDADSEAQQSRKDLELLAAVRTPAEVQDLASRIAQADQQVTERQQQWDSAETVAERAERARDALPDKAVILRQHESYQNRRALSTQLAQLETELATLQARERAQAESLTATEREHEQASNARTEAERAHSAAALAEALRVGDTCPVCLRPVESLPHRTVPADLDHARALAAAAADKLKRARGDHQDAALAAAKANTTVENTRARVAELSAILADAPSETDVDQLLEKITDADNAAATMRQEAGARRAKLSAAKEDRQALTEEEEQARTELRHRRDSVVQLGAPQADFADLARAWATLDAWAKTQHTERSRHQVNLDTTAATLRQCVTDRIEALTRLLMDHAIDPTPPEQAAAAVTEHRVEAVHELQRVREERQKAARLDEEIRDRRDAERVASELGRLLRATSFERWLCGEALDSLLAEASKTLKELSGGHYQLDRDDSNNLVVVDLTDAGESRPVHTLSGGETFQASLALALALSHEVVGLSAGAREVNSLFLDEGFGTLDEDALDMVATTLERLAADSDRMVGVITHVERLADRIPVRYVVSRTGSTATVHRQGT